MTFMRQVQPRPGERIQTKARPTKAQHRRWKHAARARGVSLNKLMVEGVDRYVDELLKDHGGLPYDLRDDSAPSLY